MPVLQFIAQISILEKKLAVLRKNLKFCRAKDVATRAMIRDYLKIDDETLDIYIQPFKKKLKEK